MCMCATIHICDVFLFQNKLGDTPLHNASWKGHADIVGLLLNQGAVTTIRNNEKQLPYDLAVRNPEVGRLLMTHSGEGGQLYQ